MSKKENRTQADFEANIQQEWSWRIKELDDIKSLVQKSEGKAVETATLRAGVPILYAHWEGFVKSASYHYFNFVTTKRHKLVDLSNNFVAISLRKHIHELLDSTKVSVQVSAIDYLRSALSARGRFPADLPLKTSNLSYEVFKDYCCLVGIDESRFELRRQFINERLVRNRNTIAHGQWLPIDAEDFYSIFNLTIELLERFKEAILEAVSNQHYKAS